MQETLRNAFQLEREEELNSLGECNWLERQGKCLFVTFVEFEFKTIFF